MEVAEWEVEGCFLCGQLGCDCESEPEPADLDLLQAANSQACSVEDAAAAEEVRST